MEGYIELGQADARKGDYFLRVTGDSMEGSHIFDGDIVFVQQCDEVDSGRIAVVMIGDEATIKKVYFKKDLMILESSN
ncbi:MAG: LexA repressor, partial [Erysipelotrichaceae bacterium]|nr:LexA repressor [Erysipelotrichaceae bacterium]